MSKEEVYPMSITHPALALEFHPSKNGDLLPTKIVAGTGKKLWWICKDCSHEWQAPGHRRKTRGTGCPACSNKTVHIDGRNSMKSTHPKMASEFHAKRNKNLSPDTLLAGTNKKLWWKCSKCEHEWNAGGNHRRRGSGCPVCSNHRVHIDGRNSLGALFPEIAKDLHPERNNDIRADKILPGTDKKLWWLCGNCDHEWLTHGYSRTGSQKSGCPACKNKALHIDGRNSLKSRFPKISKEWHPGNESLPEEVLAGSGNRVRWKCSTCGHDWVTKIINRTGEKKTGCRACSNLEIHRDGRNSLASQHPEIASEFHPHRNGKKTPKDVVSGSAKMVWWICKVCDWEWDTSIVQRTKKNGTGCPSCYGRTVRPGKKAWLSLDSPAVAKQFHPAKNGNITPDNISGGSGKKVWWLCEICKNEWAAQISSRTGQGVGCPYCSGNALHSDKRNSVLYTHPTIIKELHPTNNDEIDLMEVMAGSRIRLWWICKDCDHEWNIPLTNRTHNESGCPACANLAIHIDGRNTLAMQNPELSEELHPTKNGNITADKIIPGSSRRLWWKCSSCTHEWQSSSDNRSKKKGGRGCPACVNKVIHNDGRNSMAKTYPDMARQFHPTKNGKLSPETILPGRHGKIWWLCYDCDHEWKTSPGGRISNTRRDDITSCPACVNVEVHIDGRNSFLNTQPELVKEIHPTKNKNFDPSKVVGGRNKKLWWICAECSNEWHADISPRMYRGIGCPSCANYGYNPSKIGYLYIHQYLDEKESWLKCGITNVPKIRLQKLRYSANKFNLEIIELDIYKFDDGGIPIHCERELLDMNRIRHISNYDIDGKEEFFKYDALKLIKKVISNWI